MVTHIDISINSERLEKYRKHKGNMSFLDSTAILFVPEQFHPALFNSLNHLLISYKVNSDHRDYFLYIIGQHYLLYQSINEQKIDAVECYQPLNFLHGYVKQTEDLNKLYKKESTLKTKLTERYLEVVHPDLINKHPIKLQNTDFVVKAIYQLFKSQYDFSLKEILRPYDNIPPLSILTQLVEENEYIIDYATHYFIPQIILDLSDYIEINVDGRLSRKKYAFIFDFLFLWGVFTLNESDETMHYDVTTEFKIPFIPITEKADYIKKVLHRYKKYIKTHPSL